MKYYLFNLIMIVIWLPFSLQSQSEEGKEIKEQDVHFTDNSKDNSPITKRYIREGVYQLKQGHKYGFEVSGEIKIPIEYNKLQWDYLPLMEASMGYAGVISSNNDIIIPFIYNSALINKNHNTVNVCKSKPNKVCGVVDLNNRTIVPIIYNNGCRSIQLSKHPEIAYFCADTNEPSKSVFYDSTGSAIKESPYFGQIKEIDDNYYAVTGVDYRHGIVDSVFNYIVEPTYTHYNWFYKGYACMTYSEDSKLFNQIIELSNGEIKLDLRGLFKKPDETGIFHHNYYLDKKLISDEYNINIL